MPTEADPHQILTDILEQAAEDRALLRQIEDLLGNRSVFDGCEGIYEKIRLAIEEASKTGALRAELKLIGNLYDTKVRDYAELQDAYTRVQNIIGASNSSYQSLKERWAQTEDAAEKAVAVASALTLPPIDRDASDEWLVAALQWAINQQYSNPAAHAPFFENLAKAIEELIERRAREG